VTLPLKAMIIAECMAGLIEVRRAKSSKDEAVGSGRCRVAPGMFDHLPMPPVSKWV
jgi:hypothetical protein